MISRGLLSKGILSIIKRKNTGNLIPHVYYSEYHADIEERRKALGRLGISLYPSVTSDASTTTIPEIIEKWRNKITKSEIAMVRYTVCGRISSIRYSGSKLAFFDVLYGNKKLQVVFNKKNIGTEEEMKGKFIPRLKALQKGDCIQCSGNVGRSGSGELSIYATELPKLLSPCLHPIPVKLTNYEKRFEKRFVDMMSNTKSLELLEKRYRIIESIRKFFSERGFLEVETPILSHHFGGATARPFITSDIHKLPLTLRCAPELWLKQLVIGGMNRVFELGKNFRNEGIDATHNPEFTSCEAYCAYLNLEGMKKLTEELIRFICLTINGNLQISGQTVDPEKGFEVIEFIPALQKELNVELSPLDNSENCRKQLISIFKRCEIMLPKTCTVAHLLDKLFDSLVLKYNTSSPKFVINHPEVMSPLAKSDIKLYGAVEQRISKRFELYIGGYEICNAYEEENDPVAQYHKFQAQKYDRLQLGDDETPAPDSDFVHALEYGLPPTAGWGMGVDRLVMLMTGQSKISEILPFGSLRYV